MKKKKTEEIQVISQQAETPIAKRLEIGVLLSAFNQSTSLGPHVSVNHVKHWKAGEIIKNSNDIRALIKAGAEIEVYYKDADRTTEN